MRAIFQCARQLVLRQVDVSEHDVKACRFFHELRDSVMARRMQGAGLEESRRRRQNPRSRSLILMMKFQESTVPGLQLQLDGDLLEYAFDGDLEAGE